MEPARGGTCLPQLSDCTVFQTPSLAPWAPALLSTRICFVHSLPAEGKTVKEPLVVITNPTQKSGL